MSLRQYSADYDINARTKPHLNVGTIGHVDHGKVSTHSSRCRRCLAFHRQGGSSIAVHGGLLHGSAGAALRCCAACQGVICVSETTHVPPP